MVVAALWVPAWQSAECKPKKKRTKRASPSRPDEVRSRPSAVPGVVGGLGLAVAGPLVLPAAEPNLKDDEALSLTLVSTLGLPLVGLTLLGAPRPSGGFATFNDLDTMIWLFGITTVAAGASLYLFEPPEGQDKFEVLAGTSLGALSGMGLGYWVGDALGGPPASTGLLMWGTGAFLSHMAYVLFFDAPSKQERGEAKPVMVASPLFVF
jgi:hypothetical protein